MTQEPKDYRNQPTPGAPVPRLVAENEGLIAVNIGKSFKKRPVLRGVTLSVQRGEAVGLLGPNGAGKTTCFYIITGLLMTDTGWITMDGHDITDLPMYRRARLGIGYASVRIRSRTVSRPSRLGGPTGECAVSRRTFRVSAARAEDTHGQDREPAPHRLGRRQHPLFSMNSSPSGAGATSVPPSIINRIDGRGNGYTKPTPLKRRSSRYREAPL